jgi:hypothetical protein
MRIALKNTSEVCHYFVNNVQFEGRAGNVSFRGDNFFSYRTVVARRINGAIVKSSNKYSVTTSEHLSDLRQACRHLEIVSIPCVEKSTLDNQTIVQNQINDLFRLASTARTKKEYYLSQALCIVKGFNRYCELSENNQYIIDLSIFDNVDFGALKQAEKERQGLQLAKRKAREIEDALENNVKIDQWLAGTRDNIGYGVRSDTLLRIKGDSVQTSRGAEIPVSQTANLWALVNSVISAKRELILNKRIGVYSLSKIETTGNITVGCHYIKYEQLQRIAKILGYN